MALVNKEPQLTAEVGGVQRGRTPAAGTLAVGPAVVGDKVGLRDLDFYHP